MDSDTTVHEDARVNKSTSENNSVVSVIIPDITEHLTKLEDDHIEQAQLVSEDDIVGQVVLAEDDEHLGDHGATVAVSLATSQPVSTVSMPMPVTVGSLIGVMGSGGTFNVITPEQLQNADGSLKATHIVIQSATLANNGNDQSGPGTPTTSSPGILDTPTPTQNRGPFTWDESVHLPVLPIRCKNTSAELHKGKFGSGGRGRCIRHIDSWYTPSEFEALCGRASSKDWKRSIRFGGRSLLTLIEDGILTPHATSCTCSSCCDDDSASGPVRLFTPYKRKRRKDTTDGIDSGILCSSSGAPTTKTIKLQRETSRDASATPEEGEPSAGLLRSCSTTAADDESNELPVTASSEIAKRLEDTLHRILRQVTQVQRTLDEFKETSAREMEEMRERLLREKEQAVRQARLEAQVALTRAVLEPRGDGYSVHVVEDPMEGVTLQARVVESDGKKCSNCNRTANAECSICQQVLYCSSFCQRRDWPNHQMECGTRSTTPPTVVSRTITTTNAAQNVAVTSATGGSIMLIVEADGSTVVTDPLADE